jgi:hypothetical protein
MPLVTLQTRLKNVLDDAQRVRTFAVSFSAQLVAGPVSANAVVTLVTTFGGIIAQTLHPARWHDGLEVFAATQFADPNFGLNARLDGMRTLLDMAIAESLAILPVDADGYLLKDKLSNTGEITVRTLAPETTATLANILQQIANAIPE